MKVVLDMVATIIKRATIMKLAGGRQRTWDWDTTVPLDSGASTTVSPLTSVSAALLTLQYDNPQYDNPRRDRQTFASSTLHP